MQGWGGRPRCGPSVRAERFAEAGQFEQGPRAHSYRAYWIRPDNGCVDPGDPIGEWVVDVEAGAFLLGQHLQRKTDGQWAIAGGVRPRTRRLLCRFRRLSGDGPDDRERDDDGGAESAEATAGAESRRDRRD